jgi:hypothetical protein
MKLKKGGGGGIGRRRIKSDDKTTVIPSDCPTLLAEIWLISLPSLLAPRPPHKQTKPASSSTSPHLRVRGLFHLPTMSMISPTLPTSLFQRYVIAIITTLELALLLHCAVYVSGLIQPHIQRIFTLRALPIQQYRNQTPQYVHIHEFS